MHNRIGSPWLYAAAIASSACMSTAAFAQQRLDVTEWMYQGANGEFVELVNTGTTTIDFTGWKFDDSGLTDAIVTDISAFGLVAPGDVIVVSDGTLTVDAFRTAWSIPASVKIVGSGAVGFGRGDAYNIFNAAGSNVESFAYSDQTYPGTVRTQNFSANIPAGERNAPNATVTMPASVIGDSYGSYASTGGDVGNPGKYTVPEPTTLSTISGVALLGLRRSRR